MLPPRRLPRVPRCFGLLGAGLALLLACGRQASQAPSPPPPPAPKAVPPQEGGPKPVPPAAIDTPKPSRKKPSVGLLGMLGSGGGGGGSGGLGSVLAERSGGGGSSFASLGLGKIGSGKKIGYGGASSYSKTTTLTFEEDTIEGNLARPDFSFRPPERYPTIECPSDVAVGQEFAVQVSLTEEELTPEARVAQGTTNEAGQVVLPLAKSETGNWNLDVVLAVSGMEFTQGSNVGTLVLPEKGDSTVALFRLRAKPITVPEKTVKVLATLWHNGAYLARLERPLRVRAVTTAQAQAPASPAPPPPGLVRGAVAAAKNAPMPASNPVPALPPSAAQGDPALLQLGYMAPDLTLLLLHREGEEGDTLVVESPHLQPAHFTVPRVAGFPAWLEAQFRGVRARTGRGAAVEEPGEAAAPRSREAAEAFLRGFGRQLYTQFAPAPFKEAYWKLRDQLGSNFRTLQIFTDDPTLPWELMRPTRADGSGEEDFLGLQLSVARWHLSQDTAQLERPPQLLGLRTIAVVAPRYTGAQSLPALVAELQSMKGLPGYATVDGDLKGLRKLAQDPPKGIVHFAGHGVVSAEGVPEFRILLEDGPLDLMTWRGFTTDHPKEHPLYFFNACEVGQSKRVANFVDGWAPAVLRGGASGYIGALWPVSDQVAGRFAASFYQRINDSLGRGYARVADVLTETRTEVYRQTGDPTALGYVFYGDPNLFFYRSRK